MHREVGRAKDLLARRYVSKDVRILGSKPKRARHQKVSETLLYSIINWSS